MKRVKKNQDNQDNKGNIILVNVCSSYIRIVQLKKGELSHFYLQNMQTPSQVGSVYKAKITKKQVGLEACFVDMGFEHSAFLHIGNKDRRKPQEGARSEEGGNYKNSSLFKQFKKGQTLMVQVIKDPLKGKNMRVSHKISLPGTYLVYLPDSPFHISVSRQITDEALREKLIQQVEGWPGEEEALIIRTKAATANAEDLRKDWENLQNTWKDIQKKYQSQKIPGLIWSDVSFSIRVLRDTPMEDVKQIVVDDREQFLYLQDFINKRQLEERCKISLYENKKISLFDMYDLEPELERLLNKKVRLKLGGHIIIEETEAAVVIDVNTGGFMGKKLPEENILKINMEAVKEIAVQLRLRNCGGIILIDFIDMEEEQSRQKVMDLLSHELEEDRVPTQIFGMSELGIVQLTRKRTRSSILEILCRPCPHCEGRSYIKRV